MHLLTLTSWIVLVFGILFVIIGLYIYWYINTTWSTFILAFGIIILITAIILLCIALHYDVNYIRTNRLIT